ncbi:hypothetical protein [Kitasatospora mediocidica]|uniref:hypothetical protein n=1 Tax=Kitasatospora mediocidica TaxID=58352 RepID=UPI00055BA204|nr:hypothetical protein [Kitasatospora mediocidica]
MQPVLTNEQLTERWPEVLDAVKQRRRFTWILLSQNGTPVGVDGQVVTVEFANAGVCDSFENSGSVEVVQVALEHILGGDWWVECTVDPNAPDSPSRQSPGPRLAREEFHQRLISRSPLNENMPVDGENDDSGYGEGSYFQHAVQKD